MALIVLIAEAIAQPCGICTRVVAVDDLSGWVAGNRSHLSHATSTQRVRTVRHCAHRRTHCARVSCRAHSTADGEDTTIEDLHHVREVKARESHWSTALTLGAPSGGVEGSITLAHDRSCSAIVARGTADSNDIECAAQEGDFSNTSRVVAVAKTSRTNALHFCATTHPVRRRQEQRPNEAWVADHRLRRTRVACCA